MFLEKILNKTAGSLRFPWLLLVTATLFFANLVIPDALPFIDEMILGLSTLVLARLREPKEEPVIEEGLEQKKTSC